jgi:hypothetical protein
LEELLSPFFFFFFIFVSTLDKRTLDDGLPLIPSSSFPLNWSSFLALLQFTTSTDGEARPSDVLAGGNDDDDIILRPDGIDNVDTGDGNEGLILLLFSTGSITVLHELISAPSFHSPFVSASLDSA